jgi:hypothetical protein
MLAKLHRHLSRVHREESQSIVTLALMSLFILAILAVVVESSAVYIQRRNLQNAADAAALAGAQELNGYDTGEAPAIAAAQAYADENLPNLLGVTAVVSEGYTQVQVQVQKKAATAFAGWLSFGEPVVSAKATARIASFNIIRCVVPIAVQDTAYFDGTNEYPEDPIANPPPLVPLKLAVNGGPDGTSNTGLVDLGSGNSANPIRSGSGCGLEPLIDTKPGGTIGDVNNGLTDRLKAAQGTNCYSWADVQPPSVTGQATWRCKPEAQFSGGIQRSAVVLLPVLDVDIVETGKTDVPIAQLPNGQYLLAYFWVSGEDTYDTSKNNWDCKIKSGQDKCIIYGRFIVNEPVDLDVFDPSLCPGGKVEDCIVEFDPAATTKIIQLID